ncbi:MAG TPA: hypothetical protein VM841_05225 [Actinomycetota bacterium]|nr:hypothetical protein [Actinomycetota bacterium]
MTFLRRQAFLLAIAVAASTGSPAGAHGGGASCGSDPAKPSTRWVGSTSCHFEFRGAPLKVFGTATAASGEARLRIWISTTGGGPAIVECIASGTGETACANTLGDQAPLLQLPPMRELWCNVEGTDSGDYRCLSALGI